MKNIINFIIFKIKEILKYIFSLIIKLTSNHKKLATVYRFLFKKKKSKNLYTFFKLNYPPTAAKILRITYKNAGNKYLNFFIKFCDLKPDDRILDIGCGPGRVAYALTKYLTTGSYEGIDIIPKIIKWCSKIFTSQYPNFRFRVADVKNNWYNPKGKYEASNYKFPYKNQSFDFVFLTSVFTHMLPKDMENYFSEISRVLKRNGRCFNSFFLLNNESLKLMDSKNSTLNFKYDYGEYRTTNKDYHEAAVGYDELYIRNLYKKYGLKIIEPIHYSARCGRKESKDILDIIIAIKE